MRKPDKTSIPLEVSPCGLNQALKRAVWVFKLHR